MGASKGNKNAKGNKGGGRKSAYKEKADAQLLHDIFFSKLKREEIRKKIESGDYSLKDVFISKAFAGNDKILIKVFDKLFPDKVVADFRTEEEVLIKLD